MPRAEPNGLGRTPWPVGMPFYAPKFASRGYGVVSNTAIPAGEVWVVEAPVVVSVWRDGRSVVIEERPGRLLGRITGLVSRW